MKNRLIILLLVLMAGCSSSRDRAITALHDLGPVVHSAEKESVYPAVINVSVPEWLTDTRLYYRQLFLAPTILKTYTLDRWIAPPNELLERRFSLIKGTQKRVLRIQLMEFEQQFEAPNQAQTLLSFSVEVFRSGSRKSLGQHFFSYQQDNETADAAGAINSFVKLSDRAAAELSVWLLTLPEK